MSSGFCAGCFAKQQQIDKLREEVARLKQKLGYQQHKNAEGFFGSSTSSAKLPVKPNSAPEKQKKRPGAKPGHPGHGRKRFSAEEADEVIDLYGPDRCPDCGNETEEKEVEERWVIDQPPPKPRRILYRLHKKRCRGCRHCHAPRPSGILSGHLFGNQLLANTVGWHYLHGVPLGRLAAQLKLSRGSLMEAFHRLAGLFEGVKPKLIEEYRQSPVKHADETGWRDRGHNGYAWLFATAQLSIFEFRDTRSAGVPREIFGQQPLPGVLVVDRYAGYNKVPCALQYCYEHLDRDVQDLEKEFPDSAEVREFVGVLSPLLGQAMSLRGKPITDRQFYRRAAKIEKQIKEAVVAPAQHLGIRSIQDIFQKNGKRLYHWAKSRDVPAENNLSERDLRPTVIARKVSFGSQSAKGAKTRGTLMTVLHTLKKRGVDAVARLKQALDALAADPSADPYSLLFN